MSMTLARSAPRVRNLSTLTYPAVYILLVRPLLVLRWRPRAPAIILTTCAHPSVADIPYYS